MKFLKPVYLSAVLFFLACEYGCDTDSYYLSQGEIFHTIYHIKYEFNTPLDKEIRNKLLAFNASLNPFDSSSIIAKVNRNIPVQVDSFFLRVFNKSYDISEQTDGAFDITCAPLVNLWGFGFQHMDSITPQMIDSLKSFVGYTKIRIRKGRVIKDDPRIILNCSAIAKGYSCDVVAELFDSMGVANYLIEIGGEVRAKGKNPQGICWRIEISKPIDDSTGIVFERQEVINLCNQSMATSGNYRNFYIKNGKKYSHTLNPKTGYPSESDMLSASVIAKDCMTADGYATAFMVLGLDASCRLVEKLKASGHEDLKYYFIYKDPEGNVQIKTNLTPLRPASDQS